MSQFTELTVDGPDAQDLADILAGLTVLGHYYDNSGLTEERERFNALRRRVVVENRELAWELVASADIDGSVVDDDELIEGVRGILEDDR